MRWRKLGKIFDPDTHGLPAGKHLRQRIASLESVESFMDAVHAFFARETAEAA